MIYWSWLNGLRTNAPIRIAAYFWKSPSVIMIQSHEFWSIRSSFSVRNSTECCPIPLAALEWLHERRSTPLVKVKSDFAMTNSDIYWDLPPVRDILEKSFWRGCCQKFLEHIWIFFPHDFCIAIFKPKVADFFSAMHAPLDGISISKPATSSMSSKRLGGTCTIHFSRTSRWISFSVLVTTKTIWLQCVLPQCLDWTHSQAFAEIFKVRWSEHFWQIQKLNLLVCILSPWEL